MYISHIHVYGYGTVDTPLKKETSSNHIVYQLNNHKKKKKKIK